MEAGETKLCRGYGKPPWRFRGSALYQLHLVKSEVARALIPKEFRLVEAFGYTLGGFFLANYDDSPAGVFDELVVIAGLVWNPPTSCAWASKVLVNSHEACLHGRQDVGLPSDVARFTKFRYSPQRITTNTRQGERRPNGFLNMVGLSCGMACSRLLLDTQVTEISSLADIFNVSLLLSAAKESSKSWLGPLVKMSLPSFSGRTEHNPSLLKYCCQMECRVRVVQPLEISSLSPTSDLKTRQQQQAVTETQSSSSVHQAMEEAKESGSHLSLSVMLSKPILALEFNCLNMTVEAPLIVSH